MKNKLFLPWITVIIFLVIAAACSKSKPSIAIPTPPTISAISPVSGAAGTPVTITGTHFSTTLSDNTVKFNGVPAVITSATVTQLVTTAPATGSTGAVTVTTVDGTATGPVFTYVIPAPPPSIAAISPTAGAAGTVVAISGNNFKTIPTDNTVKFNGVAATVTSASATQLIVTAPATGTTGAVSVVTSGGTATGPVYTYTTGPDVYAIGGQTDGNFGYWKNTTFNKITGWLNPRAISLSGTDIYLAGSHTSNTPTYWKNGSAVNLDSRSGFTVAIFTSGSDVYTTGIISNLPTAPYTLAKYWKNGTAFDITTGPAGGQPEAIFVSGSDVYVAGYREVTSPSYFNACYWKNGIPVDLTLGINSNATATGIFVSGADVYVTGVEEELSGGGVVNKAPRLWKNGVSVPLHIPANSLFNNTSSVLIVGTDVYVGGQYNGAGAVWKNGTMINTASYALAEQVSSMFLYNNTDLYVSGSSSSSGMNGYWKNGNFVEMDPGCTVAGPACAVTSANNVTGIYVK